MSELPVLSQYELCSQIRRPTANWRLNYMTIGLPSVLIPEEAYRTEGRPNSFDGVVVLPPSPAGETTLTFKPVVGDDYYIYRITLHLWRVTGVAPNQVLTYIPPGSTLTGGLAGSDVRLTFYDAVEERDMSRALMHWTTIAGEGRTPNLVQPATVWRGGRVYNARVVNNSMTETFAISLVMHAIKRRGQKQGGWSTDDIALVNRLYRDEIAKGYYSRRKYLGCNPLHNLRYVGNYKTASVVTSDGLPVPIGAGTLNVPVRTQGVVVHGERRYSLFLSQLMGRQLVNNAETSVQGLTLPVFIRMYDANSKWWLTPGFVPMGAILGDGGRPYRLYPAWSLGRNAEISVEYLSYSASAMRLSCDLEGWYQDTEGC